ncbi:MAG: hypothetical protein HY298_16495 [Verrucomicrobia bacterium]|nr:hypothetical protein [Verrucomicrobiota bacterium]
MKNNPLAAVLLVVLLACVIGTAVLTGYYFNCLRKLRGLQPAIVQINYNRTFMQSLLNETQEYSKKYPSLEPLIQSLVPKNSAGASTPAPAKPAAK